jgi:hypothetical protein
MVKRVATFALCITILVATALTPQTIAGGPPACAPETPACAPQPCAPQSCSPPSPFGICGGILGICTSICGTCIGIPAAVMGSILSPPAPRRMCAPPSCPPPMCAPQTCMPQGCAPPMPYNCSPPPITKCKPNYCPPSAYGPYQYQPAGRMPLMMPLPRAEYAPALPPMGGMIGQLFEMPFQLLSGALNSPAGRPYMNGFAARPKALPFEAYW